MDYRGMSYEQASREGARLIAEAHMTGNWFPLVQPLTDLRAIMLRELARGGRDLIDRQWRSREGRRC